MKALINSTIRLLKFLANPTKVNKLLNYVESIESVKKIENTFIIERRGDYVQVIHGNNLEFSRHGIKMESHVVRHGNPVILDRGKVEAALLKGDTDHFITEALQLQQEEILRLSGGAVGQLAGEVLDEMPRVVSSKEIAEAPFKSKVVPLADNGCGCSDGNCD